MDLDADAALDFTDARKTRRTRTQDSRKQEQQPLAGALHRQV